MSNHISETNHKRSTTKEYLDKVKIRTDKMYISGHAYLYFVQFGDFGNLTEEEKKKYFKIGVTLDPKTRISKTGYVSKSFRILLEGSAKSLREIESITKKNYGNRVGTTKEAYETSKRKEIKKFILELAKNYDDITLK